MCYSAEVSFGTWIFGMLSAGYLFLNKTSIRSLAFPLMVTQMQLIEGLRWINFTDDTILSILGKLVLYAQPIAGLYELGETQYILPYTIAQSIAEFLFGSRDLRFVVGEDGHLMWKWLARDNILLVLPYWIALSYSTYYLLPLPLFLLLGGLYHYYRLTNERYETEGSLWCVSVNILWIYYLTKSMRMK
jgi:hypothetical protein